VKSKGFTIIELLSAIIVVGIIGVITIPIVLSAVEVAQKSAFDESVNGIIKAIELDRSMISTDRRNYDVVDGVLEFNSTPVVFDGKINGSGIIEINDEGKTALVIGNNYWCAKKTFSQVKAIVTEGACDDITTIPEDDITKPVITLLGTTPVNIDEGDSYTDAGAEVTDNVDATRTISGTGTVDINTPGTYTITFNATDVAGNIADTVTRTVIVNSVISFTVNEPILDTVMIPIEWNGSSWVKADSDWYDYDAKEWANVVVTTPASRATYQSASAGTTITETDVLMYLTWIPRYKFRVPDGTGPREIDIVFEEGTATTGVGDGLGENYKTHPGFTFNQLPVEGIWVGKFDTGKKQAGDISTWTTAGAQGGTGANLILIKPGIYSWRANSVSTNYYLARAVETDSDYGIDETNFHTHMSNNVEWGAISYLSHSKYGTCTNGVCEEIWINPANNFMTGCAGDSASSAPTTGCTNTYTTANGLKASTTHNIYGVFDLSGCSSDQTFAHLDNYAGGMSPYIAGSGFTTTWLSGTEAAVYINKYTSSSVIIGDAGKGNPTAQWYGDDNSGMVMNSSNAWYRRGGSYDIGSRAGAFFYDSTSGASSNYQGFKLVIVPK
jgi:prepilin-type N-terminal cleavage/methylation domain-containing protein